MFVKEMLAGMKGPFLVKDMGQGTVLYAGWNLKAVKYALKQATGTLVLQAKDVMAQLTVADAAMLAGAL